MIFTIIFLILFVISLSMFFIGFAFDVDFLFEFFSKSAAITGVGLMFCTLIWGIFEIIKLGGI